MKPVYCCGAILAATLSLLSPGLSRSAPASATPTLDCSVGPARRTFGGSGPWLVYACNDGKSLVVVTEQGNAAFPFYFMLTPDGGSYRVRGEGSGSKRASDAAGDELSHLSAARIAGLLAAARAVHRPR